jgi:signal transduction histidine kinase
MNPMNPYGFSGLLAGISSLSLGLFVLARSSNRRLGWNWLLFAISVAVYEFGGVFYSVAKSPELVLLQVKLCYGFGVLWIASLYYHFVCTFLEIRRPRAIFFNYAISALFALALPTSLIFESAPLAFNSMFFPLGGRLFPLFLCWWMVLVFAGHIELIRSYRQVSAQKKNQIKYFFLATAVGFTGGSLAYLPNFGIYVYPWGNFTVFIYPLIMSYAIVKHRLLDIDVVIRKTLIYGLCLVAGVVGYIAFVAHFTHRGVMPLANFSIFTAVLSVGMAIFTLAKAPRKRITVVWALTCFSIAVWSFGFGMMTKSQTFEICMFWQKWFLYVGAVMIPILYLHFVTLLVGGNGKFYLPAGYAAAIFFMIANIMGFLASAKIKPPFAYYTEAILPTYYAYTLYFFILAGYAHWLLFKRFRSAEGNLRNQLQYVFAGTSVGFLGGCMTFPLSFNIHIFPIGTYLVAFYLVAVTYGMYKHHLMDINVVLRKSLVYSLMTGVVTAIYLVAITQGANVFQSYFGASTFSISVMAACLITALFLPLRNSIQIFVDRYFFRDWSERGDMVREVAAGFSHELKSPLAGLSLQAQLALAELREVEEGKVAWIKALPKIKEELNYLLMQSMDAARRIEAVRGVAEPTRGQMEPVHAAALLDRSLAELQSGARYGHVMIQRDLPVGLPAIYGDAKQLEIVFVNLIKNALQAMDGMSEGQKLTLSAQENAGLIVISIEDTGPGIATKDLGRIFEPYYTTKGHKGTGMGLYLAQQIIKAHGGSIDVESVEGQGTEFIVKVPACQRGVIEAA